MRLILSGDSLRCDKSVKEEKNYGSKRERTKDNESFGGVQLSLIHI